MAGLLPTAALPVVQPLLLAAGRSLRFGADKRLAALPGGGTLLMATLARWREVFPAVHVALRGEGDAALAREVAAAGGVPLFAARSAEGLGGTLAEAAGRLPDGPLLVGLGDMPFVQADTLRALGAALEEGADIAAPFFEGRRGHPVGFSAARRALLRVLQGDRGAGELIRSLPLQRVAVDDAGVLADVDRPGDLVVPTGPQSVSRS